MSESPSELGLIDVNGLQLDELLREPDDSAFRRALTRILSGTGSACNGFTANI
jgi:hypothetical protein